MRGPSGPDSAFRNKLGADTGTSVDAQTHVSLQQDLIALRSLSATEDGTIPAYERKKRQEVGISIVVPPDPKLDGSSVHPPSIANRHVCASTLFRRSSPSSSVTLPA